MKTIKVLIIFFLSAGSLFSQIGIVGAVSGKKPTFEADILYNKSGYVIGIGASIPVKTKLLLPGNETSITTYGINGGLGYKDGGITVMVRGAMYFNKLDGDKVWSFAPYMIFDLTDNIGLVLGIDTQKDGKIGACVWF